MMQNGAVEQSNRLHLAAGTVSARELSVGGYVR